MSDGDPFIYSFGMDNFFAGENAEKLTLTGEGLNVGVGVYALHSNASGAFNTAVGYNALGGNTNGNDNSALGQGSLELNTDGFRNTAMGQSSLRQNTTGGANTGACEGDLAGNTTGSENSVYGRQALRPNITGSQNTAIRAFADVSAGDLTNATAIGANAIVDASNKIQLGNDDVEVVKLNGYT